MNFTKAITTAAIVLTGALHGLANASANVNGNVGAPQHSPGQIAYCTALMDLVATVRPEGEYHRAAALFASITDADIKAGRYTKEKLASTQASVAKMMADKNFNIVPPVRICLSDARDIRAGAINR